MQWPLAPEKVGIHFFFSSCLAQTNVLMPLSPPCPSIAMVTAATLSPRALPFTSLAPTSCYPLPQDFHMAPVLWGPQWLVPSPPAGVPGPIAVQEGGLCDRCWDFNGPYISPKLMWNQPHLSFGVTAIWFSHLSVHAWAVWAPTCPVLPPPLLCSSPPGSFSFTFSSLLTSLWSSSCCCLSCVLPRSLSLPDFLPLHCPHPHKNQFKRWLTHIRAYITLHSHSLTSHQTLQLPNF